MISPTSNAWRAAATAMVVALGSDRRNARIFADPWSRAAHTMVTGWRIRLSQRPPSGGRISPKPTWRAFAQAAVCIRNSMAQQAGIDPWRRWAASRVRPPLRYVRQADRRW